MLILEDTKELIWRCYSLERIHAYIDVEQEPKPTKKGIPPAYWPASGDLRVEKLTSRYSLVRKFSSLALPIFTQGN